MRRPNYFLGVVFLLALAGCATQYAPRSIWNIGGYTETKIAPGTFRVRFDGNEHMLPNQSDDFARLRAAELCLAQQKPFARLSQFSTDLEMVHAPIGRFEQRPKDASSDTSGRDEHNEAMKRRVYVPGQPLYRVKSYLTAACVDEQTADAVSARSLAESIRARYSGQRRVAYPRHRT